MTHLPQFSGCREAIQLLAEHGFDGLAEVIELFPPVWTAHLIDDPAAANVVGNPNATESELEAIADHYFARLDNGFEITFLGPFADSGGGVIGS